jgi:hypothetical protein
MRSILVSSICAICGLPTFAATESINPSADTFLSANNPGNNYGGAGALEVSNASVANGADDAIMKFDLSTVKSAFDSTLGTGQWQVSAVTLQLTSASPNNNIFNANAAGAVALTYLDNSAWTEGTGNPNAPTTDGLEYSQLAGIEDSGDQSLGTITAPETNSGATVFTIIPSPGLLTDILNGSLASILLTPDDSTDSYLFNARNNGTVNNRPILTISASPVPEPVGGTMVIAAAALFARRRRKA